MRNFIVRGAIKEVESLLRQAADNERRGLIKEAIQDMDRALELEPRSAAVWARRAFLNCCMRRFEHAGSDADRAIELGPGDLEARQLRATINFCRYRLAPTLADLDYLVARRPDFAPWQFRRSMVLALLGRDKEARAVVPVLSRQPRALAWGHFLEGLLHFYKGELEPAQRSVDAASRCGDPVEDPQRFELFRRVVKATRGRRAVMRKPKTKAKATGRLLLCGLGTNPPQYVTLDMMEALEGCDVLFVNISGDTLVEFLSLFCKDIRPISYETEEDAPRCAELILAACREGKKAAYVTIGNALVFGPLSARLLGLCRDQSVEFKACPGLSAMDVVLASMGMALGHGFNGFHVYDSCELLEAGFVAAAGVPTVFYFSSGPARMDFSAYQAALVKHYGREREGYIVWGVLGDQKPTKILLKDFKAHRPLVNSSAQLFIAPARR